MGNFPVRYVSLPEGTNKKHRYAIESYPSQPCVRFFRPALYLLATSRRPGAALKGETKPRRFLPQGVYQCQYITIYGIYDISMGYIYIMNNIYTIVDIDIVLLYI